MNRGPRLQVREIALMGIVPVLMIAASVLNWWPLPLTEVLGFATGGICVWLVVREHLWNWPIGLANNVFFFILFLQSRLYADMGLQVIYFALGIYGWMQWLHGGERRTALHISRTTPREWIAIAAGIPLVTFSMREILVAINGAAPLWDALTTVLSLAAQYLLCRKRLENWWFWIAADIIYIPLYFSRGLPLTGVLYAIFLAMCVIGLTQWRATLRRQPVGEPLLA